MLLSSPLQNALPIKTMKNPLALFLLSMILISCGNDFRVKGTISSDVINGEYVYIKMVENGVTHTIDSCKVQHGAFEMSGNADSVFITSLYIGNVPILPFVAEKGNIELQITDNAVIVGGTPLNDELNALIRKQAALEERMAQFERLETSLILNGSSAEAAADSVSDSIAAVGAAVEALMNDYVRRNFDNVLGPCIFALMYSAVPAPILDDKLNALYNDAPSAFRNDAFVKSFYDVARENASRLQQMRLQ